MHWRMFFALLVAFCQAASAAAVIDAAHHTAEKEVASSSAMPQARRAFTASQTVQAAASAITKIGSTSQTGSRIAKDLSNGLYFQGNFAYQRTGSSVLLTVDDINNDSFTRTTGTLRLELWATSSAPARGAGFTGYRLAASATLAPLATRTFYSNVVETTTFLEAPAGTYYVVFVLSEFDSVNCATNDHYCVQDSAVFSSQITFGSISTTVTLLAQSVDECFENYPAAAVQTAQQLVPGVFAPYPPSASCASLGIGYFAGLLYSDSSVRVYTANAGEAQVLCSSGLVTSCTASSPSGPSYTDLWWNPAESGWGISITHHPATNQIFAAWYTYDGSGKPKWYVASSCPVANGTCTGTLYETTGTPLGAAWNNSLLTVHAVGSITFRFESPTVGLMSYTVNGISDSKIIIRNSF
jgi:hypothetical protein